MNEMQQQSQGVKTGEISLRRCNIWIYLSCCPQKQKAKTRVKKDKQVKHTFGLICIHTRLMM